LRNLRDPAAILLLLDLNSEDHDVQRSTNGRENSIVFVPSQFKIVVALVLFPIQKQ
jgi:hypothetical protein